MKINVIHGPNLNMLGERETQVYGTFSLDDVNRDISELAMRFGATISASQFNSEGEIVEALHGSRSVSGVILNPAAFSHYSYAIHDAIKSISVPVVEVHISNIYQRESFRHRSVTASACVGQISGCGKFGYLLALEYLVHYHANR